jgi:hypothetical protein
MGENTVSRGEDAVIIMISPDMSLMRWNEKIRMRDLYAIVRRKCERNTQDHEVV